jgi:hypothetical protein
VRLRGVGRSAGAVAACSWSCDGRSIALVPKTAAGVELAWGDNQLEDEEMDSDQGGFQKIAPYLKHPLVLVGFVLFLFFGIHRKLIDSWIIPPLKDGNEVVQAILAYGFWIALAVIVLGIGLQYVKSLRR